MPDTYEQDPNSLPPLTKAIRESWPDATPTSAAVQPGLHGSPERKMLDAIRSLEDRVIALEA
jgi:hypothetical protein